MGGTTPLIGFHSVMESPERVRRTNPPNTTRNATMKAKMNSQFITARFSVFGILFSTNEIARIILLAQFRCSPTRMLRDCPAPEETPAAQLLTNVVCPDSKKPPVILMAGGTE